MPRFPHLEWGGHICFLEKCKQKEEEKAHSRPDVGLVHAMVIV